MDSSGYSVDHFRGVWCIFFISYSNSVEPDQMLHSVASDLGLHCLPMLIFMGELAFNG